VDVRQTNELLELAKSLVAETTRLRDVLEWEFLAGQLVEVFTEDYDLGEFVRIEQITGGYVNLSFAIWADDGNGETSCASTTAPSPSAKSASSTRS
jgi:hypothetical protein